MKDSRDSLHSAADLLQEALAIEADIRLRLRGESNDRNLQREWHEFQDLIEVLWREYRRELRNFIGSLENALARYKALLPHVEGMANGRASSKGPPLSVVRIGAAGSRRTVIQLPLGTDRGHKHAGAANGKRVLDGLHGEMESAFHALECSLNEYEKVTSWVIDLGPNPDGMLAGEQAKRLHATNMQALRHYQQTVKNFTEYLLYGRGPEAS